MRQCRGNYDESVLRGISEPVQTRICARDTLDAPTGADPPVPLGSSESLNWARCYDEGDFDVTEW